MEEPVGTLKVFVATGCHGCKRALEVAEEVRLAKPQLAVKIIDLAQDPNPAPNLVFAVPTYVYGGRAIFLGNPSPQQLQTWLNYLDLEV